MMNVLECLQPKGEIPAHSSVEVEFVFSPLEAKQYQVSEQTTTQQLTHLQWCRTLPFCLCTLCCCLHNHHTTTG